MDMKKRTFALLLALAMMFAMVACGGNNTDADANTGGNTSSGDSTSDSSGDGEKIVVGFSQVGAESAWRIAMTNEMQAAYDAHSDEFEYKFSDGQQKQENQIKAVRSFIQQGVDYIVLCPVVESGWDAVLTEAKDAGIPVILVNRSLEMSTGNSEDYYATFIGPDNILAGGVAANYVIDKFADDEGPVNIVEIEGTVGAASAVDRNTGFDETIASDPKFQIVKSVSGNYTTSEAKQAMEAQIKACDAEGIDIDVVFSHSDDMGMGVIQAMKEAGLKPGQDIVCLGVDGSKSAFEAIVAGEYNCTVENPLGYGEATIDVIRKLEAGESVDKWIVLENRMFDETTAPDELPNRTY